MAYDVCKKCQRFFEKNGNAYCDKCQSELDDSRFKISEFLESHPGASLIEIVKGTDVKLKDVNIFLENGGAVAVSQIKEPINLRQEELKREEELMNERESFKIKNSFTPRRLRR